MNSVLSPRPNSHVADVNKAALKRKIKEVASFIQKSKNKVSKKVRIDILSNFRNPVGSIKAKRALIQNKTKTPYKAPKRKITGAKLDMVKCKLEINNLKRKKTSSSQMRSIQLMEPSMSEKLRAFSPKNKASRLNMNINAKPENFTTTTVEVKELQKMAMFHQNMIRKINRKVQKAKVENGRFFSPIRLVRKLDHLRSFQDIETEANLLPRIKSFT